MGTSQVEVRMDIEQLASPHYMAALCSRSECSHMHVTCLSHAQHMATHLEILGFWVLSIYGCLERLRIRYFMCQSFGPMKYDDIPKEHIFHWFK